MKLSPDQLESAGYVLMERLDHRELVPFIQTYLKKRTFYSVCYFAANFMAFGLVVFLFALKARSPGFDFGDAFGFLSIGIALTFGLIPLHEMIHALAYRLLGATQTSFDADWKKLVFMAVADRFVADRREFLIVALAPFVVISTVVLALLPMAGFYWQLALAGIFLTHTACCSGDFGLLSYFAAHRNRAVATYDDRHNKVSFFYGFRNGSS
ncbi:DUF3267 domain-containing protein [Larkinella soli]|uniref:DUF3267 domain-containing protein n=1 Tax=Larkinella soli TaxID=1770527 RepID=UPI000FFB54B1|nr:DUF3267 domain-containing protein [Larkinella soli]